MSTQSTDITWFLALPITAIIAGLIVAAVQQRGLLPATTARILLAAAWLCAVVSSGAYLVENSPIQHRILIGLGFVGVPFGIGLVLLEVWMARKVRRIEKADTEQSRIESLPKFTIHALDAMALAPYSGVYLATNVFRNGVGKRKKYLTTLGIVFENRATKPGDGRVDNVSAKVIIRAAGIGMEQSRIPTACWVNEPTADIDLPLDTPKALYLGGWEIKDKSFVSNQIKLFRFDRALNKPVDNKPSFIGFPHNLLLEIILTPKGFPEVAQTFHFNLQIEGLGSYRMIPMKVTS